MSMREMCIAASEEDFARRVMPLLEKLTADLARLRPDDPKSFTMAWLGNGGEVDDRFLVQGSTSEAFVDGMESVLTELIRSYVPPRYPLPMHGGRAAVPPPITVAAMASELKEAWERYQSAVRIQAIARGRHARLESKQRAERSATAAHKLAGMRSETAKLEAAAAKMEVEEIMANERALARAASAADEHVADAFFAGDEQAEAAAVEIQRVIRGRAARRQLKIESAEAKLRAAELAAQEAEAGAELSAQRIVELKGTKEEESAAIAMQSAMRGHLARADVARQRARAAADAEQVAQTDEISAKAELEDAQHKLEKASTPEEKEAAVRIQALARGRHARKQSAVLRAKAARLEAEAATGDIAEDISRIANTDEKEPTEEENEAAIAIQKIARGRAARKQYETTSNARQQREEARKLREEAEKVEKME